MVAGINLVQCWQNILEVLSFLSEVDFIVYISAIRHKKIVITAAILSGQ